MESSRNTPEEDLILVGRAQDQVDAPRGFALAYDVVFSIVCGVFVGSQALPLIVRPFATIVVVLSFIALVLWWRRRMGWWLSGYAPQRARWVAFGLFFLLLGLMVWAWVLPELWVALTAGATAVAIAFMASRLWTFVWRRERVAARSRA